MSDRVQVSCPHCGKSFSIAATKLGAKGRCSGCSKVFTIEQSPADPPDLLGFADEPVMRAPAHLAEPPAQAYVPPPGADMHAPQQKPASKTFNWSEQSIWYKVGGIAFIILAVGALVAIKLFNLSADRSRRLGEAIDKAFIAPDPVEPAARPAPPPPPPAKPVVLAAPPALTFKPTGTYTEAVAVVNRRHAKGTRVRLILPPGEHADASLPCVFVAPAGSNLLTGVAFGDDEHEDYLPLLARGFAVCLYTLDGTASEAAMDNDMLLGFTIMAYIGSEGGMKNLADAIDTTLASAKMIDPARLATAGHSSAGTIAVMAAAREPRIKAAAAFAPALDLPERFKEDIDAFDGRINQFIFNNTPSRVDSFTADIFIHAAEDDDNTPVAEARAFAQKHGQKVTLVTLPRGGHGGAFTAGRAPAFDFLANKLNATPIAMPEPRTPEPKTPAPQAQAQPAPDAAPARPDPWHPERSRSAPPAAPVFTDAKPPLPEDRKMPGDKTLAGWSLPVDRARIRLKSIPKHFVLRTGDGYVEIVRPSDDAVAPRIRLYPFDQVPQMKGTRNPRPQPDKGIIFVDPTERIVHVHKPENTKDVPFLLERGQAMRTEGDDRDLNRPTREVLYSSGLENTTLIVHLIAGADDENGLADLEAIVKSFQLVDPAGRPIR